MSINGGNVAALNVQITSNVTQVQGQLTALQRTLQNIRGQGGTLIPNLNNAVGQLVTLNGGMNNTTQSMNNMHRSSSAMTNTLLGWVALGPRVMESFKNIGKGFSSVQKWMSYRTVDTASGLRLGREFIPRETLVQSGGQSVREAANAIYFAREAVKSFNNTAAGGINKALSSFTYLPGQWGSKLTTMFTNTKDAAARWSQQTSMSIRQAFPNMTGMISNTKHMFESLFGMDSLKQFGTSLRSIASMGMGAIIVATGIAIVKLGELTYKFLEAGIKYNAMMEQMRTGYNVMLQGINPDKGFGKAQAGILMDNMKNFANQTPFTMPQVAKGADMLLGYGVGTEGSAGSTQVDRVTEAVKRLGDVSRGIPEKFNDIAYAYGQVTAMGRLQGQELRQLINAGWNPLMEMVTKDKGMSQLKQDMEDGMISIDDVTKALIKATSEGGRFYGMMKEQSMTGTGKMSTITDKASMLTGAATESMFNALKPLLDDVINLLDAFMGRIGEIGNSISQNLVPPIQNAFGQFLQLVGLTNDGAAGFDNVSIAVDNWTKFLGSGIKVFMVLVNVGTIFVTGLIAGLAIMGAGFFTLWKGLEAGWSVIFNGLKSGLATLANIFGQVFLGVGTLIINAILSPIADLENAIRSVMNFSISAYNAAATAIGKEPIQFKFDSEGYTSKAMDSLNVTAAQWSQQLAGWNANILKGSGADMSKTLTDVKDEWAAGMEDLNNVFKGAAQTGGGAWKNLLDGTGDADKFLNSIKPKTETWKPLTGATSLLGAIGSTKSSDELKKTADAIQNLTDKLVNMGNAFDKMTYEKFSPYKATIRMKRFFDEMSNWTKNLAKLAAQGIPQVMIAQLREMGISGYGLSKGLVNASDSQRKQIIDQYQASRGMALNVASAQVGYENAAKNIIINNNVAGVMSPALIKQMAEETAKLIRQNGG